MRISQLTHCVAGIALLSVAMAAGPETKKRQVEATGQRPDTAEYHLDLAERHLKAGVWPLAERSLEQALAKLPAKPVGDRVELRTLTVLAGLSRRNGNHEQAKEYALRLIAALKLAKKEESEPFVIDNSLQLADDYTNLKNPSEAKKLLQELLAKPPEALKLLPRLTVLMRSASLEEFLEQPGLAKPLWQQTAKLAQQLLSLKPPLMVSDQIECLRSLVCALEALKDPQAPAKLKELRTLVEGQPIERELLVELAVRRSRRSDFDGAEELLAEARNLTPPGDSLGLSRLHLLRGDMFNSAGNETRAKKEFLAAATELETLAAALDGKPGSGPALGGIWRQLRNLHQQAGNLHAALDDSKKLISRLKADGPAMERALLEARSVHGSLLGAAGEFDDALPLLEQCVAQWRKIPNGQRDLASAINNLGAVHRSRGDYAAAATELEEALEIRKTLLGEDHPDIALSRNNLASVYVARGEYRKGLETYQQVQQACLDRGERANALLSTTLLNMAMVYRSQGMIDKAIDYCRQSLELQKKEFGDNSPNVAGHYNALSTLYRASGNYPEAFRMSERVLAIAKKDPANLDALAATAHYNLGIICRVGKAPVEAKTHLEEALTLQVRFGQRAASARTRNFLGLLAFEAKNYEEARKWFEEAAATQEQTGASPQEKYSTLCNLAGVCHELKETTDALKHLENALKFAEQARAQSTGDEADRATLFARFSSAVELQVVWNLEAGEIEKAIDAAEQGRSRTFLDQVQLAQGNLRENLVNAKGEPWKEAGEALKREKELREKINTIQMLAAADRDPDREKDYIKDLNEAQDKLSKVWSEIRAHSGVYQRMLVGSQHLASYQDIRKKLLKPGQVLLYYVLGFERSYVVLIDGDPARNPEMIELEISSQAAARLSQALALRPTARTVRDVNREAVGLVASERGERIQGADEGAVPQKLTRSATVRLVAWYLLLIQNQQVADTREAVGKVQTERGKQLVEAPTLLAFTEIFLPAALRQRIATRQPASVLVVPDGALHQLPLEALVVEVGQSATNAQPAKDPKYVLDAFPPIAYAPSASVMLALQSRPAVPIALRRQMLSVGNPAYAVDAPVLEVAATVKAAVPPATAATTAAKTPSSAKGSTAGAKSQIVAKAPAATPMTTITTKVAPVPVKVPAAAPPPTAVVAMADIRQGESKPGTRSAFLALGGRLEPLPGTAKECDLIARLFKKDGRNVKTLVEDKATEVAVKQQISGKGYVHVAAHGLVDERFDNLFGALALSPPLAADVAVSDGFLSYNEILELPLKDCDLAALSACKTNVGPERPLETASSLAQAFLAAGARRVLASHWSVADNSTAELMASFFDNVVACPEATGINYAAALHAARLKVKSQPESSEPFFWAPFVLIGPPMTEVMAAAPAAKPCAP